MGEKRGRSRTRMGDRGILTAINPSPLLSDTPSSSSTEVSRVCESPLVATECGNLLTRKEDLIREVAISLRRSSQEGDLRNLINWVVIPLAEDLSLSSSLGRVGQERLFVDLATDNQKEFSLPILKECGNLNLTEGGAMQEPRGQIVNHVT
ncbi:hypothetical protein FRX31_026134 [Thalictrum thalictroides]|uniref:Uncharacterized protein n=1 Tax=Thalictrum thalictroides TaxID=46969 RepID=A0A7J6VGQ3_THATH|nr:hypothetical protein FRX31_026134 [Thalictrum thalictroides]